MHARPKAFSAQPRGPFLALLSLLILLPLFNRLWLGWSHPYGICSDIGAGGLLLVLIHGRAWRWTLPLLLVWLVFTIGTIELVGAVGRMPEWSDLGYLTNPEFLDHSTGSGSLSHPWLAALLGVNLLVYLWLSRPRRTCATPQRQPLSWRWGLLPMLFMVVHTSAVYLWPRDAGQWLQYNLPHKLLAKATSDSLLTLTGHAAASTDISGLTQLDLEGKSLLSGPGQARNVLIITLEGIPGGYIKGSRDALHSSYSESLMPRLSEWANHGMLTADYVLHSHQTIRGLYAMLCGDFSKLDTGTPKGLELLNNPQRSAQCLPAQLRDNGFDTHYLQGAGLRFMAKDQVMPQMGFTHTHGRDWFQNQPYQEFPWGMDDKSFFEGSLSYIDQLQAANQPWMLTLLTVGTHQPYSAPAAYLERYPDPKHAAIAYLDDAVSDFLNTLQQRHVLDDTLVIVTSDESHGIDKVRLASAWGFNLMLAPEPLPALKQGTYGHVDLTASVLDYFALPVPANISGRSLLRDYTSGREMISYTNGLLRKFDGHNTFSECDFQDICRLYRSDGFIRDQASYLGKITGNNAQDLRRQAYALDQSLDSLQLQQHFSFANQHPLPLRTIPRDDWVDNLVGAQYLELSAGTQTTVTLKIRGIGIGKKGAHLTLKTKEFDRDVELPIPPLPLLTNEQPLELSFDFTNPITRKAFSFHLLGQGKGAIEITEFTITSRPVETELLATHP